MIKLWRKNVASMVDATKCNKRAAAAFEFFFCFAGDTTKTLIFTAAARVSVPRFFWLSYAPGEKEINSVRQNGNECY